MVSQWLLTQCVLKEAAQSLAVNLARKKIRCVRLGVLNRRDAMQAIRPEFKTPRAGRRAVAGTCHRLYLLSYYHVNVSQFEL